MSSFYAAIYAVLPCDYSDYFVVCITLLSVGVCMRCVQFDKIFEAYTKYCLEQEMCREYIKTNIRDNDLFRTFIAVSDIGVH